jgi:hypothetical protein
MSGRRTRISGRTWVVGSFVLATAVVTVLFAASAWQSSQHASKQDEAESHLATAALLKTASEEGQASAQLLTQYVTTGDEALIERIQDHSAIALESMTQAIAQSRVPELETLSVKGAQLAQDAGRIVALRRTGDVEGAMTTLEEISPTVQELSTIVLNATDAQLQEASSLEASARSADDIAAWLRVAGLALGAATLLGGCLAVARGLAKRRVVEAAPSG